MKTQFKLSLLGTSLLVGAASLATPAFAQDQDQEQDQAASGDSTIVVTGSLISNPNIERAAPVNVTSSDEIDLLQSNVAEEILREIPGIVPSIGSAVNNGNGGNSFVNLRGLGSNRNVVLLDGTRLVPATLAGQFDLNNVPLALIERVEVLTGGSSTTYGADAISGVVNFITRQDFAGLEVTAASQITEQGDGHTVRFDVTTGANFDDGRGNVVLSVGYQQADPVYQGDRKIGQNTIGSFSGAGAGSGTAVPSRLTLPGSGTLQINPAGNALVGTYAPFNFSPDNIFQTPFERFNIFGAAKYEVTDGIEVYTRGLFSKNTVDTIIAPSGSFGIAVTIPLSNPFLPAGIRNQFCNAFDFNAAVAGTQPLTAAQCTAAATATSPTDPNYRTITTALFRRAVEAGPRISNYQNTVFDYKLGIRGGITDTIDFDVFGSYGQSDQVQTIKGYTLNSRFRQGLLATNPNTCLDTSNGCVPINIFSPTVGGITPAMVNFLVAESTVQTKTTLAQARATVSGDFGVASPFANDPISFAVGGEYRKYTAQQASDSLARSGDLGGAGGAAPNINGQYDVYEAIGELVIPVVQGKPFFEDLTIEAGIRYSDYTVDDPASPGYTTTTWKAGGSWTPVTGAKIRGFYARAVRAPNISELFSPVNTGLTSLTNDPCASINDAGQRFRAAPTGVVRDVCLAQGANAGNVDSINVPIAGQANATSGGNLALGAEKSNSYTIGAVFEPSFIPGFSMTIDYYNIKISGAITTPSPDDALDACFNAPSVNNPACTIIRRDPITGGLNGDPATTAGLFVGLSNLGRLATDGIDLTMNYRRDLGFADLALSFVGNWTNKSTFQSTPTSINRDCVGIFSVNCGSLQPEFQWTTRATLGFEGADVSLLWRHIDSFQYEFFNDGVAATPDLFTGVPLGYTNQENFNTIPSYDYFDITTRFDLMENLTVTLTVQNIFDKKPPLVGSEAGTTSFNSGNTFPSTYDALGRRFGVQARLRF
ncbi:TonB-dependent receptor domain-containing protein [Blastomonas sp.]|uniref:TonB-dependent receptor domain-containing protein n=1 Tax=Blastomonas sp. TaxID=1909299 RepID=UPI00406A9EED